MKDEKFLNQDLPVYVVDSVGIEPEGPRNGAKIFLRKNTIFTKLLLIMKD